MPEAPQTTDSLIGWLKNNVIAVITLTGVFLYIIFSIPATIFYGRLGTTPSEVGFNYSNILSEFNFRCTNPYRVRCVYCNANPRTPRIRGCHFCTYSLEPNL